MKSCQDLALGEGIDLDCLIIVADQHDGFVRGFPTSDHVMYAHRVHNLPAEQLEHQVVAEAGWATMLVFLQLDEGTITVDLSAHADPTQVGRQTSCFERDRGYQGILLGDQIEDKDIVVGGIIDEVAICSTDKVTKLVMGDVDLGRIEFMRCREALCRSHT